MAGVLIVSQGAAFMADSLGSSLAKEGIEVFSCEPVTYEIKKNIDNADVVILYAWENIAEDPFMLEFIKNICEDEFKYLCVVGYQNELSEIEKSIPLSLITFEFTRPFDIKEFTDSISSIALGRMAQSGAAGAEQKYILLCNNDILFIKKMRETLTPKYKFSAVRSGGQALSYISNRIADLIIYDFDMPVSSNPQIMQTIVSEAKTAKIPIVFLTGKTDKESIMKVMYMKPDGYMLKTMSPAEISSSVDNFFSTGQWRQKK